ncbi:MAG: hypothetical protein AB8B58_13565, partial [Roseobacter sp.]
RNALTTTRTELLARRSQIGTEQVSRGVMLTALGIPTQANSEDQRQVLVDAKAFSIFMDDLGVVDVPPSVPSLDLSKIEEIERYSPKLAQVLAYQRATVPLEPRGATAPNAIEADGDSGENKFADPKITFSELKKEASDFIETTVTSLHRDNILLDSYNSQIAEIDARIKEINVLVDKEVNKLIDAISTAGNQSSSFLIASGITRFGIVAIIVFIIQILVTLYRYNMRLASFYSSRLSALVYGDNETGSVEFFSGFFDTKEITFGKDVIAPTQSVNELVKSAIEQAGKAWAAKTP